MEGMVNKHKNHWRNKNVFVTGCTGLLGSWLVKTLVENGANVTGLIRDWVPKSNLILQNTVDKINTVRGEIEDYFQTIVRKKKYDISDAIKIAKQIDGNKIKIPSELEKIFAIIVKT